MKKPGVEERLNRIRTVATVFEEYVSGDRRSYWEQVFRQAFHHNGWFTADQIDFAFRAAASNLTASKIAAWATEYGLQNEGEQKRVGIVMAGNIPMAGLHDILSVLLTGHLVTARLSAQDNILIPAVFKRVQELTAGGETGVTFTEESIKGCDFYIASGSNNTARHFREFFGKYPSIIRGHRNSAAILTGKETADDLKNLGTDIFTYYGLGCRSVSKLFLPEGYDHNRFFEGIFSFKHVLENNKYAGNLDYYRAIYLLNRETLLENGFVLYKEDKGYASPPATLFWEYYKDKKELNARLDQDQPLLQCVVGNPDSGNYRIPFGQAQYPALNEYADAVDTVMEITETIG